jgi:hypothetical protein
MYVRASIPSRREPRNNSRGRMLLVPMWHGVSMYNDTTENCMTTIWPNIVMTVFPCDQVYDNRSLAVGLPELVHMAIENPRMTT